MQLKTLKRVVKRGNILLILLEACLAWTEAAQQLFYPPPLLLGLKVSGKYVVCARAPPQFGQREKKSGETGPAESV